MITIHKTALSAVAFGALFALPSRALADGNVNCQAYAQITVAQAKEAKQRGCGYSGPVWSLDFNFHKTWCQRSDVHMANLTREDRNRDALLKKCANKQNTFLKNLQDLKRGCLKYARKAQKLRAELNQTCSKGREAPRTLKQDVDWCVSKGGPNFARVANTMRFGKITGCQLEAQRSKLEQVKTFYSSGMRGIRSRRWLPVDVCLRKFYKDNSWFLGLGGGITDVPFADQCGKAVADGFCITRGYLEALFFETKVYDNGSNMDGQFASTYWIGSKKACHGRCAGFKYITCKGKL